MLAQLVEQRTFNPFVVGSTPAHPTNKKRFATFCGKPFFCMLAPQALCHQRPDSAEKRDKKNGYETDTYSNISYVLKRLQTT
jgi:hypothetical protein